MTNTFRNSMGAYFEQPVLAETGLTTAILKESIAYTYHILDMIDKTLIESGAFRLSQMMELANLSTFIGNLLGAGIANASMGIFRRNSPHKYPDLLAQTADSKNLEIKVALMDNKPKGHLAKAGYYVTCRYVLGDADGNFTLTQRGDVVWIWELRCGKLDESDFNRSNTEGDSGKTAVVNRYGMTKLEVVYCDLDRLPFSPRGSLTRNYLEHYTGGSKVVK